MAHKPRKLTKQEALIAQFARHSISNRSTFHPNLWGNGREPADMIITIGRALIFVTMTESKKTYFEQLCEHNLKQARDRIAEWQSVGKQIRGSNEWRSFVIDWSDVDHIHVLSVVDGDHAACIDHPVHELEMDPKVRLCTTVTTEFMEKLARLGGGARDLIDICKEIKNVGKLSKKAILRLLRKRYSSLQYAALEHVSSQPSVIGKAVISGKVVSAFDEYRHIFLAARQQPHEDLDVIADLSWFDILPAIAWITQNIAEMEGLSQGQVRSAPFGENTKFRIIVSTNTQGLIAQTPELIKIARNEGASFLLSISLTNVGPIKSFHISEPPIRWSTELDLSID